MDEFILRALLAGAGVTLVAGPIGCVVVWRRMAYFGATLSHAALLGVALGFLLDINLYVGILFVSLAASLLLTILQRIDYLAADTLLGILAHGALATGLIVIALMENIRVDLMGYLFGDILAIGWIDLLWIYLGGAFALGILYLIWDRLLAVIVHEDLARVEGIAVEKIQLIFLVLLSVVIAIAMQLVGVLLIVSMLIIPPAVLRQFVSSPEQMAFSTVGVGILSVILGVGASLWWDAPTGPAIVVVASLLFLISVTITSLTNRIRQQ